MLENIPQVIIVMGETLIKVLPTMAILATVFTVLTHYWACNPGYVWWRKRELLTDLMYWFFVPLLTRMVRISLLIMGAGVLFNMHTPEEIGIDGFQASRSPTAAPRTSPAMSGASPRQRTSRSWC